MDKVSRFQKEDKVLLNLNNMAFLDAVVDEVRFTESQVIYDLAVTVYTEQGEAEILNMTNVESIDVFPADEKH